MGLGTLDGTAPLSLIDFDLYGAPPAATKGIAQGYLDTAGTGDEYIIGTVYNPQVSGAQRSVKSASANDTSAGTGARTITISYLTAAFLLKQETITMNGTTAVATVGTDYAYVEVMVCATVGSNLSNAGNITLYDNAAGGGGTFAQIGAGDGQTFYAQHYVPAGVTARVTRMQCGATAQSGKAYLIHTGNPSSTNLPEIILGPVMAYGAPGQFDHQFSTIIDVAGPDLIVLVDDPLGAAASTTFGSFEYIQF